MFYQYISPEHPEDLTHGNVYVLTIVADTENIGAITVRIGDTYELHYTNYDEFYKDWRRVNG